MIKPVETFRIAIDQSVLDDLRTAGADAPIAKFRRWPDCGGDVEWADRFFNVQRWTPMESGGHFGAMEEPEPLARDLRDFFRRFR